MRKISLLLFMCLGCMSTYADNVSRQEAQQIASRFFAARGKVLTTTNVATYSLLGNTTEEYAPYYVFNAAGEEGFVIVSGNSLTGEILGYSDSGTLDEAALPDNMRAWLEFYAAEIAWVGDNESEYLSRQRIQTYSSQAHHAIAPLLMCKWGQSYPYNSLCPPYTMPDGTSGPEDTHGLCVTGCVGTALAQVISFYKYPLQTKAAIPEYKINRTTEEGATVDTTLPAIPAGTEIDWDNILDSYDGDYTDEQALAVGLLNLCVGQSLEMIYGISSGSSFYNAQRLFENHLGFAEGVKRVYNMDYEIQAWQDLIYSELEAGYPIAYGGNSSQGSIIGGHAFVIDGYDGEGFFHVNWGWCGGSDGYFRLTVLDSTDGSRPDLSSAYSGFTINQDAMIYIRRPGDEVIDLESLALTITSATIPNRTTSIRAIYANETGAVNSYDCAVVMRSDNGQYVSVGEIITEEDWANNASKSMMFDMSSCFTQPGEYRLSPASRVAGTDTWYPYWTLNIDEYILATVDDDLNVTLTLSRHSEDVTATNWEFSSSFQVNVTQHVIVTFENAGGEYKDNIALYTIAPNSNSSGGTMACQAKVDILGGGESKVRYYFTPDVVGEWTLYVSDGSTVFGTTTVEIVSSASDWPLERTATSVDNDSYGSRLVGTMRIKNNADEPFTGKIKLYVWTRADNGATAPNSSVVNVYELGAGKTQNLPFEFIGLDIGTAYDLSARNYETDTASSITNGDMEWKFPYLLQEGVLQWSNDGSITGSAAKSDVAPTVSVAGMLSEGASHTMITPSKNTNTIYAFTAGTPLSEGLDGCNVVYDGEAELITLANNGYAAYMPVTFTAHEAVYRHTFATVSDDGVAGWEALTLPFKPDGVRIDGVETTWKQGDGEGDFYLREFAYEDDNNTAVFTDVEGISSLWANMAYVIAATPAAAGKTVEFYASEAKFTAANEAAYATSTDDYYYYGTTLRVRESGIYVLNDEGSAYEYKSNTSSVDPFTNYFVTTLPEGLRPEKIVIASTPTGIRAIESAATATEGVCYDLQGRRITAPTKGVYILNGKKYVK